jgi:hypothetical protein
VCLFVHKYIHFLCVFLSTVLVNCCLTKLDIIYIMIGLSNNLSLVCYDECDYAESQYGVILLTVVMLNVIMQSAIILSVMFCVILKSVIILLLLC